MKQSELSDVTADGIKTTHNAEFTESDATTTVVNLTKGADYDIYIGRGDGFTTILDDVDPFEDGWLGNPFTVESYGRQTAIEKYREVFLDKIESNPEFREAVASLEGKRLGCYCAPRDCHGDVIVDYLD